jgi:hypothetical protein
VVLQPLTRPVNSATSRATDIPAADPYPTLIAKLNIIHIGRHAGTAATLKSNTGPGKVHSEIVSHQSSSANRLQSIPLYKEHLFY